MANEVISKGIKLYHADEALTDLMEIPELGGVAEKIDVTTLDSVAFMYCDGIKNYGDSLEFKFLYKKEQFTTLNGLEGSQQWKVELPDNTTCSFSGSCSVKLEGVGVNAALTYVLSISPDSEMTWA